MAPLMPQVVDGLARVTGARFEVLQLENTMFGASVTTAGLLPGAAFLGALRERDDFDLALLPAEAVNDDLVFMDDLDARDLAAQLPMPVRFSYDFADALIERGTRNVERETARPSSAFRLPTSAFGEGSG